MAQRRYRPTPPPPRRDSRLGIALATGLLVVVAVVVGVLVMSTGRKNNADATPTVHPSASPTAQVAVAATPSPEVASPPPTTVVTPTATRVVAPPPTPIPPTPTPLVGKFGDLPPADMPSGNSAGRALSFQFRLNMSLQGVPTQAPVYQLQHRTWTATQVHTLADSLGIGGTVADQGGGSFRVSGTGSLYVSTDLVQYAGDQTATPVAGPLPTDDILIQEARSWLLKHQIVGADAGPGTIANRNTSAGQATVLIKPVQPSPILSQIPSASITLAASGNVLEANVQWPAGTAQSSYGLRSASDLWGDVQAGRGYVEVSPDLLPSGSVQGTVTLTAAGLAYTTASGSSGQQYLVPLVVFSGTAAVSGASQPVPVKVYVSAAGAQSAPRG